MFKTHATISFLFVHTQFITIRITIKTTATAAAKVDPFSIVYLSPLPRPVDAGRGAVGQCPPIICQTCF